ncbi:MAG: hypothetical protein CVU46_14465 [Chloroflexi bacterium HGW-Chloroflexi-8]|nr:MAG: hypothetical protein CVU46_14465 [Chloroflexi bacterium HGW-Chloroflexi-8]
MTKKRIFLLMIWLAILSFPFAYGYLHQNKDLIFGGFLLNPIDGNSYLAKIQQGYAGNWFFQLPYSFELNSKAILFVFYIIIGHISRIIGVVPIIAFHIFRLLSAIFLFYSLLQFLNFLGFKKGFLNNVIFIILIFGGGLGWLYVISGDIPADFWVSEAFPFLSSISNPHFPLTISLICWTLILTKTNYSKKNIQFIYLLIGIILANISPFSILIVGVLLFSIIILNWNIDRKNSLLNILFFSLGSFPFILYQFIVVNGDPVLAGWNAQNITPAPNLINFIFSFSPFLAGIIFLLFKRITQVSKKLSSDETVLLIWVITGIFLLYLPLNLQRRFLVGYYIPVVTLFFLLLSDVLPVVENKIKMKVKTGLLAIILFSILSNVFVLYGATMTISSFSDSLYVSRDLISASKWIKNNCETNSLVLAGLDTGLLIPSYSFSRTVFGHPFETINYTKTETAVSDFWSGNNENVERLLLKKWNVDYIYYGVEEKSLGKPKVLEKFPIIYQNLSVQIYKVLKNE